MTHQGAHNAAMAGVASIERGLGIAGAQPLFNTHGEMPHQFSDNPRSRLEFLRRTAYVTFRQSFWHSLPLMSPMSLGALRCLQLVNEDAQQGTGCSFDQFLPPWRQRGHRVVRGQFAYKVVNACLRARLHSLDDANIDPPPPILFVHIASLHEPPHRPLLLLPSTVRLLSVV